MQVNVSQWIDSRPVSLRQIWVVILAGLIVTFDGIEIVITGGVSPVIAKQWHISPLQLGSLSSLFLLGIMVGAFISGPLADRIGRKLIVVVSTFLYGIVSLLTAYVSNVEQLLLLRFIVGIGVGGSLPNVIPLADEYSPRRIRKTMVSIAFMGVTIGGVVVSLLAQWIIPSYGWRAMFFGVAGVPAIVLGLLSMGLLPESIRFLVVRGRSSRRVAAILRKIDASAGFTGDESFYVDERNPKGFPVRHLFDEGQARNTILLWVMFACNLLTQYLVNGWLTVILTNAGFSLGQAIWGLIVVEGAATIGGLLLGIGADHRNPKWVLVGGFLLGIVGLVLMGNVRGFWPVMIALFMHGLGIVGAQFGLNALAATVYPTAVRSTGVSWALGVGRLGGIAGPLMGAWLVSMKMGMSGVFFVAAVPALIAMCAMILMRLESPAPRPAVHATTRAPRA
ncbi:MAG: MFS transporter [Alicyclobacillaceae bacterium]|nr:MFS transporter [Alicyclobacillaceae bacterium]